ncbi:unnamed protein product [Ilex paraguariensis]|uniref:RNase H type-1 domain-containing protein n=1 Tax=Ilex paraguariensis TaxID=185542 RepID=A0ABC8R483_9AQUA
MVWTLTSNGIFSVKSALELVSEHGQLDPTATLIWKQKAEANALLNGLLLYYKFCLSDYALISETDSQLLLDMVKGKLEFSWKLRVLSYRLLGLLSGLNYEIAHVFPEANSVADYLANMGVQDRHAKEITSAAMLPFQARLSLQQDQPQIKSLRCKDVLISAAGLMRSPASLDSWFGWPLYVTTSTGIFFIDWNTSAGVLMFQLVSFCYICSVTGLFNSWTGVSLECSLAAGLGASYF